MNRRFRSLFTLALLAFTLATAAGIATAGETTLTPPALSNLGANQVTLTLQSDQTGSGYFTLLAGNDALCGSGDQVKAGLTNADVMAPYHGSLSLIAATPAEYTLRNLTQSTPYTLCFTADDGATLQSTPVAANLTTMTPVTGSSQDWKRLGIAGFSTVAAAYTTVAFAPDGTPYVAFTNGTGGRVTVMKYSAGAWGVVGNAQFSGNRYGGNISLAFSPDGTPHVVYVDVNTSKLTVMKYSAGAWGVVGIEGFSTMSSDEISLAFSPDGTPYVAYRAINASQQATVMKYSGDAWVTVGNGGFSAGAIWSPSLAFAPDGTPYVAYTDHSNGQKATVMKYSDGAWVTVGNAGFNSSGGMILHTFLTIAADGTPYVSYMERNLNEWGNANATSVMKYSTGAWVPVGKVGATVELATYVSLAIAPDGTPYMAYNKAGILAAVKYSGDAWVTVGKTGLASATGSYTSLAFAPDGSPHLVYQDSGNGSKSTVMKLVPVTTTTVVSDSNPASVGELITFTATVDPLTAAGAVTFKDTSMSTVLGTVTLSSGSVTVSSSALSAGVHNITAIYGGDDNYLGSTSTPIAQTVNKLNQTITFDNPGDQTYGSAKSLTASSTSPLTPLLTSVTTTVCTISSGALTFLNVGTCTINANQSGNSSYNAAAQVQQSFTVNKAPLTITNPAVTTKVYNRSNVATITGTLSGIVGTDIYVALSPSGTFASMGVESGIGVTSTSILTGGSAGKYTLVQPTGLTGIITAKPLAILSAGVQSKVYDKTTAAVITGSLSAFISGDTVTLNGTGVFAGVNKGTLIPVTSTSTLGGADAGNYTLTQPTGLTGTISAKPLTIESTAVTTKVYDKTDAAVITGTLGGVISGDTVILNGTGTFNGVLAGSGKTVTSTCTISGTDVANYTLTQPTGLTGTITAKPLTITTPLVTTKFYDKTTAAVITGTLSGIISGDSVTLNGTGVFAGVNKGTLIPVTSTSTLGGADRYNYTLTQPTGLTGTITPKPLAHDSASPVSKVYDKTNAAVINGTLSGIISGDSVTLNGTGVFASVNKGIGIAVTSTSTPGGADAANYTVSAPTYSIKADITPRYITVTAATNSKPYDLTTSAAAIPTITAGALVEGDTVSWTETYDNMNIGVNKVLTPAGTVTDGNGGANYFVTFVKNNTGVITKRPATVSVGNLTQAYTGAPLTPSATTIPAGLAVVWSGAAQIAAGSYQVTATINDPTYEGSQSGTFTVTTLDTTVAVASEINPVFTGSPVTFIATVSPRSAATGIVTFKDNGEIIGAGPVSGSTALFTTGPLGAGSHAITVEYGGDNNYNGSTATNSFTQLAVSPPVVTTAAVGGITTTGALFGGTVNPNGNTVNLYYAYGTTADLLVRSETLVAGGHTGFLEGAGATAMFSQPTGLAMDRGGNLYVADHSNNRIRKITPDGMVSTLAGSGATTAGYADGTGAAAQFSFPTGIAADSGGNLYVADNLYSNIRKITPDGVVTTLAGSGKTTNGGYLDGTGAVAKFYFPSEVAVDSSGNVYVADAGNNRIRKITPGGEVSTLAGSGAAATVDGQGVAAQFNYPTGVAVDSKGIVYVADYYGNRIRKITPGGAVTTLAGSGTAGKADGLGAAAQFNSPYYVAVDSADTIYVSDYNNAVIRKITPEGLVSTLPVLTGSKNAVLVDGAGSVYASSSLNGVISKYGVTPSLSLLARSGLTGADPVTDSLTVAGLLPQTTYYYRAVTKNSSGTVYGDILSFTTQATTTTSLLSSLQYYATYGANITFTATVTPSTATGAVTFKDGTTEIGTGTLIGGKATLTISNLSVNSHSITAVYGGDGVDGGSTSPPLTQSVSKAAQTITFLNPGAQTYGTTTTLTASVSSGLTPTFTSFGGICAITPGGVLSFTATGSCYISVNQVGDANYTAAAVVSQTFTINKATLTVTAGGVNKRYDGAATATVILSDNRVPGDSVSFSYSASFPDKNVGAGRPVSVSGISINGGVNSGNYILGNSTASTTADITARSLTVSGMTATGRPYDGTTAATLSGGTLSNVINPDSVTITGRTGAFADAMVGSGKQVTVTAVLVDNANYTVTNPTGITAAITAKSLTVSGMTADSRPYDRTTAATLSGGTLNGVVTPDSVEITGRAGVFADGAAGSGKQVNVSSVTVNNANYTVINPTGITADITAKSLTVSGMTAGSRPYDGTTAATLSGGTLSGVISPDSVTITGRSGAFADAAAGSGKQVNVSSVTVNNTNYTVTKPTGIIADITAKSLTVSGMTATSRPYDGATTVTLSGGVLSGVISPDSVTITGRSGGFADGAAGSGKQVTVTAVIVDNANYTVTNPTGITADITARSLTVSGMTAGNRPYDRTTTATLSGGALNGVVTPDSVAITGRSGAFADGAAGNGKQVNVTSVTVNNANYTVTNPTGVSGDITPRPITVTAATNSKRYDGTVTAAALPTVTSGSLASGDTASWTETYDTKEIGTGKSLIPAGTVADGNGGANYAVTFVNNNTGVISTTPQTITFGSLPTVVVGGFATVSATGGGSGNPITYSSGSTACTVSGSTVTGLTAGTANCVITANQAGSIGFEAGTATQSISVGQGNQTITFGALPTLVVGGSGIVSAFATSGLGVTFGSSTPAICTVNGSTVTGIAAGSCSITADQAGLPNYKAAPQVTRSIAIGKRSQTITFGTAPLLTFPGSAGTLKATVTSALAVTFGSTTPSVCTVSGALVTPLASGACVIVANQAGDNSYDVAPSVTQNITIGAAAQRTIVIQTTPPGLEFTLDGISHLAPYSFTATAPSYIVNIPNPTQSGGTGTRYLFTGWSDNGGASHTITPTASGSYTANFGTQYQLTILSPTGGSVNPAPGASWYAAGSNVGITATANSGYSFTSWALNSGVGPIAKPTGISTTITMNGPNTVTPTLHMITTSLSATVGAAKTGTIGGIRSWPIVISNAVGSDAALNVQLNSVDISATANCKPTVTTDSGLPRSYGAVNGGSTVTNNVLINFANCAKLTKFVATIRYSADGGISGVANVAGVTQ